MYVYIHVPLSLSPLLPSLPILFYQSLSTFRWIRLTDHRRDRCDSGREEGILDGSMDRISLSIRAEGWIFSRNLSLFNISPAYFRDAFSRIGGHRGWCNLTGKHGGETIFGLWSRERRTKVGREMFSMHRDSIGRRIILTRGGRGGVELWRGKMPILSLSLSGIRDTSFQLNILRFIYPYRRWNTESQISGGWKW